MSRIACFVGEPESVILVGIKFDHYAVMDVASCKTAACEFSSFNWRNTIKYLCCFKCGKICFCKYIRVSRVDTTCKNGTAFWVVEMPEAVLFQLTLSNQHV